MRLRIFTRNRGLNPWLHATSGLGSLDLHVVLTGRYRGIYHILCSDYTLVLATKPVHRFDFFSVLNNSITFST